MGTSPLYKLRCTIPTDTLHYTSCTYASMWTMNLTEYILITLTPDWYLSLEQFEYSELPNAKRATTIGCIYMYETCSLPYPTYMPHGSKSNKGSLWLPLPSSSGEGITAHLWMLFVNTISTWKMLPTPILSPPLFQKRLGPYKKWMSWVSKMVGRHFPCFTTIVKPGYLIPPGSVSLKIFDIPTFINLLKKHSQQQILRGTTQAKKWAPGSSDFFFLPFSCEMWLFFKHDQQGTRFPPVELAWLIFVDHIIKIPLLPKPYHVESFISLVAIIMAVILWEVIWGPNI